LIVESVWFVNCLVIVCLFVSRSQPSNGDGDYSIRDEDEELYDIAKPGKPSFESYQYLVLNCIFTRITNKIA
jgi:hypothetical protein